MCQLTDLEQKVFKMYEDINIGCNEICKACRKKWLSYRGKAMSRPTSVWHIGKDFNASDKKVLFVGKNARGEPGELYNGFINCCSSFDDNVPFQLSGTDDKWAFWSYTQAIVEKIGLDWDRIAMTNLIKCNRNMEPRESSDRTTKGMKKNCQKLEVFKKELEIIQPNIIVFYTGKDDEYDNMIKEVLQPTTMVEEVEVPIPIAKQNFKYLCFESKIAHNPVRVLRFCHPERKDKPKFVNYVSNWIMK